MGGLGMGGDCHATAGGHDLEFLFFEVSATLVRKK